MKFSLVVRIIRHLNELAEAKGINLVAVLVLLVFALLIFVIFLITYIRNPFYFPYLTIDCDVSGKRNVTRGDVIDEALLDGHIDDIEEEKTEVEEWYRWSKSRVRRSIFKKHRARQLKKKLPDKTEVYRFRTYRKYTRYRWNGYRRYRINHIVTGTVYTAGYSELIKRYRKLREGGFKETLFTAEKKRQRGKMTQALRKKIMERDNYTCQICGRYMPDGEGIEIDHIIPIAKGGKTVPENLQCLCSDCNGKKSDKMDYKWSRSDRIKRQGKKRWQKLWF